jgi:asparagine synthase (glutamine-hydrolysing)
MASRGPDGVGAWISPGGEVGLGHRRLAILDLSDAGLQPMSTPDRRYWIVFNGEIYNFREIRADLEAQGLTFRTGTDTEVILLLYAHRGEAGLAELRGMFSFALWDQVGHRLLLARDLNGIKPLYYSVSRGHLRFASQVKALLTSPAVSSRLDPAGIVGFLLWGCVPEPFTLHESIDLLPAGHLLEVSEGKLLAPRPLPTPKIPPAPGGPSHPEAVRDSVRAHLVSDVPVAVFLSAGLDSAMVAALARDALGSPPLAVTLRFAEFAGTPADEGPFATEVARKLGLRHVDKVISREGFLQVWPDIVRAMDQPSIDGINSYLVCRAAREAGVKVALTGVGGDELFGGYPSFRQVATLIPWITLLRRLPGLLRLWPALAARLLSEKPKIAGMLRYGGTTAGGYFLRRGLFLPHELPAIIGREVAAEGLARYDPESALERTLRSAPDGVLGDRWREIQLLETTQYLRNQLLRDSDWASMAHGLELRTPLVDAWLQRRIETCSFEPARSEGKATAVSRVAPQLPAAVLQRKKSGFSVPTVRWLGMVDGGDPAGIGSRRLALELLRRFGADAVPNVDPSLERRAGH